MSQSTLGAAVKDGPAKDLIASVEVCDLNGKQAGTTKPEIDGDGKIMGK